MAAVLDKVSQTAPLVISKVIEGVASLGIDAHTRKFALDILGKETVKEVDSFFLSYTDPLIKKMALPLFNVWSTVAVVLAYFSIIVLLRILGAITPNFGKTAPFKLIQIAHNLFLIVASFWSAYNLWVQMNKAHYGGILNDLHRDATGALITQIMYCAWILRIYEFGDTFLIMLKKNYRQASFLHIYHHASVLCYIWFGVLSAPNGETVFPCFLNSCVHVVMYTYYLASTLNIRMPFKYSITIMQLIQFVWISTVFGARLVTGKPGYPAVTCYVSIAYMGTMLFLFGNFFIKNALSKPKPTQGKAQPKALAKAPAPRSKTGAKKE